MAQQIKLLKRFAAILFLIAFMTFVFIDKTYAQNAVNVNTITGTANITIPIHTVSVGDLSAPVALSYSATGLKVANYDNSYGQGWNLIAAASVYREVRGFPDDVEYQSDPSYSTIKGWIRSGNNAPATIQSLTLANTGTLNCANEISDANTIASNFPYTYDTEPDNFHVSAPGLSCNFVFDASHNIKITPFRDYIITYTADSYGRITAFTIINDEGIKYYFDKTILVENYIATVNPGTTVQISESNLEVFKRDYMMYRNKTYLPGYPTGVPLKYYDSWMLTKMEDLKGNAIKYTYSNNPIQNPSVAAKYSVTPMEIIKPDGAGGFTKKLLYNFIKSYTPQRLLSISTQSIGPEEPIIGMNEVVFNWGGPGGTEDDRLLNVSLPVAKKTIELLYTRKFLGQPTTWQGYGRYFLKGVKSYNSGALCNNVSSQFSFNYYGISEADNTCYCAPVPPPPTGGSQVDTIVNAQDYWGYYNGKYSNANLDPRIYVYPDNNTGETFKLYPIPNYSGQSGEIFSSTDRNATTNAKDGSLKSIIYPNGAVTDLEYENNRFFDKDVNGEIWGGGIRIKKITNNDGLNTTEVTEYEYADPSNSNITTGKALSVPKFTIPFPNSTTYSTVTERAKNSTYRTSFDLNNEAKTILYYKVTVKKTGIGTGIGKTIYTYNIPGTFGDAALTDWKETKNYVARTNLGSPTPCVAIAPNFFNNKSLEYPFSPNTNYDFEQGLLSNVSHYNEANQVVASEDYTYTRSHPSPISTVVSGLKLEEIGNTIVAYGKYNVNTTVDNFLSTKVSKLYNSSNPTATAPIQETESYVYTAQGSSDPFRVLKETSKTNSNGDTYKSKFKYAKEFYTTTNTGSDQMNLAIDYYKSINKNVLVESYQSRTDVSGERVIGANLTTFKPFTIGGYTPVSKKLPSTSYQFLNQAGVTNFSFSDISGGVFSKNSNYTNATPSYLNIFSSIEKYNANGSPQVLIDNNRIPKTVISADDYEMKIAEFSNARTENIGYSNFEYGNKEVSFVNAGTGNAMVLGGHASSVCMSFQPNTSLCRLLTKPASAKNMIISFWLKKIGSKVGAIYLCTSTTGCSSSGCTGTPIVSFNLDGTWQFYQVKVPYWTKFGNTTFTYSLSTSAGVYIDDILMYPENSGVATNSYTYSSTLPVYTLTAKMGINGIGNTYEYDNAGRLWLVRDQYNNILEMKKYKQANFPDQPNTITIGRSYQKYVINQPADFNASVPVGFNNGDCTYPSIVYKWNFGDGSAEVNINADQNGFAAIQHTYTAIGKYVVTVTASSPEWTDIIVQTPPVTNVPPAELPVEVANAPDPVCTGGGGTPVICAAGIIQYTSNHQCILSYCAPMTADCSNTNFRLTSITGGSMATIKSVTWEIADIGSSSWSVYYPEVFNQPVYQTSQHFHVVHSTSYKMRAKVKFCDYSISYSNSISVINGD